MTEPAGPDANVGVAAEGARAAAQYDEMAAAYAHQNETGSFNHYYERPAIQRLLGAVSGQRVLDVGCGAGILTQWLCDQGATVTAFDVSPAMVAIARKRIGMRADVYVGDASSGLGSLGDGSFDVVVASLVMHYLEDWVAVLREFHRVLKPGGAVTFSTHHPSMDWRHSPENYFAHIEITEQWNVGGRRTPVTFWRRSLGAMTEAIAAAGFVIERLEEPTPSNELAALDPKADSQLRSKPQFLFFRLRR